jgi:MFS family permease
MLNRLHARPWLCLVVLGFGYTTGMQLGKVSPYVDRLEADLGLGLAWSGWLTSVLAVFVAITAASAGRLIARTGTVTALKAGALIMVIGATWFGTVSGPGLLLAARAVEAAGYVLAVVAAPAYLASAAPGRLRTAFLALWGSVVPVGFALANLLASGLSGQIAWSDAFLIFAVPLAVFALPVLLLLGPSASIVERPDAGPRPASDGPIAWLLVLGFGLYVYLSMGFLTFLPKFIHSQPDAQLPPGVVALFVPAGSFAAAAALTRLRGNSVLLLAMTGFLSIAASACLVFSTQAHGAAAMAVYAFSCGICASSLFASVPLLAGTQASSARTIGAMAQAGGIATLFGPPVAGSIIENLGWSALAGSFVAVTLVQTAAILITCYMSRSRLASRCSDRGGAAVDREDRAGDPRGCVGGQEQSEVRHVLGLARAQQRLPDQRIVVAQQAADALAEHDARRDRVDPDVARSPLQG